MSQQLPHRLKQLHFLRTKQSTQKRWNPFGPFRLSQLHQVAFSQTSWSLHCLLIHASHETNQQSNSHSHSNKASRIDLLGWNYFQSIAVSVRLIMALSCNPYAPTTSVSQSHVTHNSLEERRFSDFKTMAAWIPRVEGSIHLQEFQEMHHSRQPLLKRGRVGKRKVNAQRRVPLFVNQLQEKATPLYIKCKANVSCRPSEVANIQDLHHLI